MSEARVRHVNPLLMTGLVALPAMFVWFLLIPGYPRSTRVAAFTYLLLPLALSIVGRLLGEALRG